MILLNKSEKFTVTFDGKDYEILEGKMDIPGNTELCKFIISMAKKWGKDVTVINDSDIAITAVEETVNEPEVSVETPVVETEVINVEDEPKVEEVELSAELPLDAVQE